MLINEYLNLSIVSAIYCIFCKANNKRYIGSSVNIKSRLSTHYRQLYKRNHFNRHLQDAYNLYGQESFYIEILEYTDINNLIEREQYWINFYNTYNREKGFNWGECAKHPLQGIGHTEATKEKIRESKRKNPYKFTPEQCAEMSRTRKGKKLSEDQIAKIKEYSLLAHEKEKKYIQLINPDGILIQRLGLRALCLEFNLNRSNLSKNLLSGRLPHYKGWRLYQEGKTYEPMSTKRYISDESREKMRLSKLGKKRKCNQL